MKKKINIGRIIQSADSQQLIVDTILMHEKDVQLLELNGDEMLLEYSDEAVLDAVIDRIKDEFSQNLVNKEAKEIYRRHSTLSPNETKVWQALIERGDIVDYGEGHIAFTGIFLRLFNTFNKALTGWFRRFAPQEINFPNFVSFQNLAKLGLTDEFPHYLSFVSTIKNDFETIREFQEKGYREPNLQKYLANPTFCLKTSACSLLYPFIQNKVFNRPKYFTTLGLCTRKEQMYSTCERLREFHQKELVLVGDKGSAKLFQEEVISLFTTILEAFDMEGKIVTASDSFFLTRYKRYRIMQLLNSSKFEMRIKIPDSGNEIAAGSFNNHDNYFSSRFDFYLNEEKAKTACMGIGLERLVYAVLCYHGIENEELIMEKAKQLEQKLEEAAEL